MNHVYISKLGNYNVVWLVESNRIMEFSSSLGTSWNRF